MPRTIRLFKMKDEPGPRAGLHMMQPQPGPSFRAGSADSKATAAALSFREEVKMLGKTIAAITPV